MAPPLGSFWLFVGELELVLLATDEPLGAGLMAPCGALAFGLFTLTDGAGAFGDGAPPPDATFFRSEGGAGAPTAAVLRALLEDDMADIAVLELPRLHKRKHLRC